MTDEYTKDSLQIARLEERMQTLTRDTELQTEQTAEMREQFERQLSAMRIQLEQVLSALSEARGGWRTLMWLGGVSATFGGLVSVVLNHLSLK